MVDLTPSEITEEAADIIDERGWRGLVRDRGLGGIFWTLVLSLIGLILAIGEGIRATLASWRRGLVGLVDATFGQAAEIMIAGGQRSAWSFTEGMAAYLGPFAWPAGMFIGLAGIYVALWFYQQLNFNPMQLIRRMRR